MGVPCTLSMARGDERARLGGGDPLDPQRQAGQRPCRPRIRLQRVEQHLGARRTAAGGISCSDGEEHGRDGQRADDDRDGGRHRRTEGPPTAGTGLCFLNQFVL